MIRMILATISFVIIVGISAEPTSARVTANGVGLNGIKLPAATEGGMRATAIELPAVR